MGDRETHLQTAREDCITGTAWLTLFMLTLVYTINIADRYVLSTLIEPIKNEFGLSDSAVGFLTGTSLAIFYVCAGLPLGVLADRVNRKKMIAISVGFWSAATALCGMSTTFYQLMAARIGVGIGEAGGTPPSHSLISDRFPPHYRAFALSVVGLGASIGAWLGASGAGMLNEVYGWRHSLLIFGLVGIPVSLLIWVLVREPKRGAVDDEKSVSKSADGRNDLIAALRFTWQNKALLHVVAGATMITFWGWGILWWTPSFLVRSFGLTVGDAGSLLGPIHGIGGTLLMIATVLITYYWRHSSILNQPRLILWTTLIGTLVSIYVFVAKDIQQVTMALWVFTPIIYIYIGPTTGLLQNLYPPRMRAKGIAILLFTANIANLAIAPQLIGLCSDLVAAKIENPHNSLKLVLLVCAFTGFWAAWHYAQAIRYMKKQGIA
jgi:MFS family permease